MFTSFSVPVHTQMFLCSKEATFLMAINTRYFLSWQYSVACIYLMCGAIGLLHGAIKTMAMYGRNPF